MDQLRDGSRIALVVTADRAGDDGLLASLIKWAAYGAPLALVAVMGSAWIVAQQGMVPLRHLRDAASSISTRDLSYRVPLEKLPSEVADLALAFNQMLARLADGVSRLSEFSGDLAHEMRTPISNMLGKTQVILSRSRAASEYSQVLESNVEELERLGRLVHEMLFLAQVDQAKAALQLEVFDLSEETRHVVDFLELAAEDAGVKLVSKGSAKVLADRQMIRRAVSNLVSNALRYTPAGKSVTVAASETPEAVELSVSNPGYGIPAEHLPHLFERFYRVDPARSRAAGGTGLGLAIVRSIMELHGGRARVESMLGVVTTFTLSFSLGSSSSERSTAG